MSHSLAFSRLHERVVRNARLVALILAITVSVGGSQARATTLDRPLRTIDIAYPLTAVFSPDGRFLVTADLRGVVMRESQTLRVARTFSSSQGAGRLVAFSRDGRLMATGSPLGKIIVFDVLSGRTVASLGPISTTSSERLLEEQTYAIAGVDAIAMSPDGRMVAAAENIGKVFHSKDYTWSSTAVHVWDVRTGRKIAVLRGHEAPRRHPVPIVSVAFAPHSDILATGGEDGTARLWHARTGRLIGTLNHRGRTPFSLAFTNAGNRLITATREHVRAWELRSGQSSILASIPNRSELFWSFALDHAEKSFAVGLPNGLIRFWNLDSGRALGTIGRQHQWRFIVSVAFSPDRRLFAAAPWEGGPKATVEIWNLSRR